jgi:hypothetical protein
VREISPENYALGPAAELTGHGTHGERHEEILARGIALE